MTDAPLRVLVVVGVVPPAGQRRHQLGPPSAGAPRRSRGTRPSWWPRPARRRTPGSRCAPARGAYSARSTGTSGIGLETRRPAARGDAAGSSPDVVHIASPATLGYQAARRGRASSAIPTRGDRPDRPGRVRRARTPGPGRCRRPPGHGLPDAQDPHPRSDRTWRRPRPACDSSRTWRCRGWRCGRAASTSTRSTPGSATRGCARQLAPDGRMLVGYVGRLAPEKELELLDLPLRRPPLRAGGRRRRAPRRVGSGDCCPTPTSSGCLHGAELGRAYAVARRVRAHRSARDLLPAAQEALRLRRPGRRAARRRPDRRRSHDGVAGLLYEPGDGDDLGGVVDRLAARPVLRRRMGAPHDARSSGRSRRRSTRRSSSLPRGRGDDDGYRGWPPESGRGSRSPEAPTPPRSTRLGGVADLSKTPVRARAGAGSARLD